LTESQRLSAREAAKPHNHPNQLKTIPKQLKPNFF